MMAKEGLNVQGEPSLAATKQEVKLTLLEIPLVTQIGFPVQT
jgi:hypothetical protein